MSRVDRLFVVDPVRHDRRGHHWHFAEGVLREAERRNFEPRFFVARSAGGRPLPGPGFHPVFRHGLYRPVTGDRNETIETDYRIGGAAFCEDLAGCPEFDPGARDLIVIPTASLRSVGGIAKWRAATGCATPVVFFFHFLLPFGLDLMADGAGKYIAREAGREIRDSLALGPFLFTASSPHLASTLTAATGCDVSIAPLPLWYDLAETAKTTDPALKNHRDPTIAFVGELRREKGGHLLPDVIAHFDNADPAVGFVVQAGVAEAGLLESLDSMRTRGSVRIVREMLSEQQYRELIEGASAIVLPYDRKRYLDRTSGAFAFAAAAGRPCVVPDGTWMADKINAGWASGTVYRGSSATDVATAVVDTIERLPDLSKAAQECAMRWHAQESGTAFLQSLFDWAASAEDRQGSSAPRR
jgi:glycosyltransferase involved in cell wall biosynthesis